MNMKLNMPALLMVVLFSTVPALAQKHEIGLLLGGTTTGDRDIRSPQPGTLQISTGLTYYANYAYRVADLKAVSIHFEVPFAATPSTDLKSSNVNIPRNYASFIRHARAEG